MTPVKGIGNSIYKQQVLETASKRLWPRWKKIELKKVRFQNKTTWLLEAFDPFDVSAFFVGRPTSEFWIGQIKLLKIYLLRQGSSVRYFLIREP